MAIFLLDCVDASGRNRSATYDTETNAVTIDGISVELVADDDIYQYIDEKRKNTSSIKKLKILLGAKCNMKCSYCAQKEIIEDQITQKEVLDTIRSLKANLPDAPEKIELWGGEPLVYWKTVKQAVPLLKAQFPDAQIGFITNGTLLDDEKVDWIIANDVVVTVSHDGVGQSNRGIDPLDDPKVQQAWRRLADRPNGLGISALLVGNSYDPLASRKYFEEKLGGKLNVVFDVVSDLGGWSPSGVSTMAFTKESLDKMTAMFLSKEMRQQYSYPWDKEKQSLLDPILCKDSIDRIKTKCGIGHGVIVINGRGELLVCQFNAKAYAHMSDLGKVNTPGLTKTLDRACCPSCPFVHMCKGACPHEKGNTFAVNCQAYFAYYRAVFAAVFEDAFGLRVKTINGKMLRPVLECVPTPKGKTEQVDSVTIPWPNN